MPANIAPSMSDTEEDSTSSDSWPVNEDWLIGIIKTYHKTSSKIKITVSMLKNRNPNYSGISIPIAIASVRSLQAFKVTTGTHDGVRNLSDILGVSVEYELQTSPSGAETYKLEIIIKLLPNDPFSRYFITEAQFDLREIQFYTKVLPDMLAFQAAHLKEGETPLTISVPKCLHSHYVSGRYRVADGHVHQHEEDLTSSPEPPESILVLQDMRPFGYRAVHFIKGLTLAESEAALRAIANVHAITLAMKTIDKVDLNERYKFLFQVSKATDSYQQLVEQGLPQLTKFLEKQSPPTFEKVIDILTSFRSRTRDLIENLLKPEEPMGLMTHTDFWCNNLLFNDAKMGTQCIESCVILDWQMITYSRPTNDIALLMVSSLSSDIRRKNTGQLLDVYYDALKVNSLKLGLDIEAELGYSRDKLMQDYRWATKHFH